MWNRTGSSADLEAAAPCHLLFGTIAKAVFREYYERRGGAQRGSSSVTKYDDDDVVLYGGVTPCQL